MSKIEPVVLLLTGLTVFLVVALFCAEKMFPSDAVFFQSIAGLLTTISGALMMRVKPQGAPDPSHSVQVSQSPSGESSVEVKS